MLGSRSECELHGRVTVTCGIDEGRFEEKTLMVWFRSNDKVDMVSFDLGAGGQLSVRYNILESAVKKDRGRFA
jgi:hypothetical protein